MSNPEMRRGARHDGALRGGDAQGDQTKTAGIRVDALGYTVSAPTPLAAEGPDAAPPGGSSAKSKKRVRGRRRRTPVSGGEVATSGTQSTTDRKPPTPDPVTVVEPERREPAGTSTHGSQPITEQVVYTPAGNGPDTSSGNPSGSASSTEASTPDVRKKDKKPKRRASNTRTPAPPRTTEQPPSNSPRRDNGGREQTGLPVLHGKWYISPALTPDQRMCARAVETYDFGAVIKLRFSREKVLRIHEEAKRAYLRSLDS